MTPEQEHALKVLLALLDGYDWSQPGPDLDTFLIGAQMGYLRRLLNYDLRFWPIHAGVGAAIAANPELRRMLNEQ